MYTLQTDNSNLLAPYHTLPIHPPPRKCPCHVHVYLFGFVNHQV